MTAPPSLGRQVAVGAGWLGASRLTAQGVQFGCGLVLARLLSPTDFGLVAGVYVISGFTTLLFEGGLRTALIHAPSPTQRDYSTVFWVNALAGVAMAGLLALLAPSIADFYGQPRLAEIAPIVGLGFAFATGIANSAMMQRELKFRAGAALESGATIVGLILTLVLALRGFGPFALAVGPVAAQMLISVGYAILRPWRPSLAISLDSLRRLYRYSLPLVGSNLAVYAGRNIDSLLIGRFLGAGPLGFYSRAYNLMLLPLNQVTQTVGDAVTPGLGRLRDDPRRAGEAYMKSLRLISFATMTFMIGLAATAPALVEVLWGSKWQPSVVPLQVLALAGIPQCLQSTTAWLYQSQHATRTMLVMTLIFTAFAVALLVIGVRWGVLGICAAVFVRFWVGLPFELSRALHVVGLRATALVPSILRALIPTLAIGVVVLLLPSLLGLDRTSAVTLIVQVVSGLGLTVLNVAVLQRDLLRDLRLPDSILPLRFHARPPLATSDHR